MGEGRTRLAEAYLREIVGPVARQLAAEAIQLERERRSPVRRAGRALGSLWRTIASGGFDD